MKPSHDIDVAALERAADEVQHAVRADELRILAESTAAQSRQRERELFDVRWLHFWKCTCCGARLESLPPPRCCSAPNYVKAGYTPKP